MTSGNVTVTVVVGGKPVPVTVNGNQKVEHLIKEALHEAGQKGANPADWNLRTAEGHEFSNRDQKISDAGIVSGVTLYLDPAEGGGGNAPTLVDPAVSTEKLESQLEEWQANSAAYRARGWLLLGRDGLKVEVGFACRWPIGPAPSGSYGLPVAVRFDFSNYDIWAPSVTFIDLLTRQPIDGPFPLQAIDFQPKGRPLLPGELAENSLIFPHPLTKRAFLCKRGVREYHQHPEHSGDDWLLYRGQGLGTLATLCTTIWRLMVRNLTGFMVVAKQLPAPANAPAYGIQLQQEDVDAIGAQIAEQIAQQQALAQQQFAQAQRTAALQQAVRRR